MGVAVNCGPWEWKTQWDPCFQLVDGGSEQLQADVAAFAAAIPSSTTWGPPSSMNLYEPGCCCRPIWTFSQCHGPLYLFGPWIHFCPPCCYAPEYVWVTDVLLYVQVESMSSLWTITMITVSDLLTLPMQRQSAMWHRRRRNKLPGTLHTIWLLAASAAPRLQTGQMKVIICEPWPPPLCSGLLPPIRCFNEEGFSGAESRAGGPLTGSRRWRPCKSAFNSTSLSLLPS